MSALVLGLDLIMKYCKKLKYIKNVILITDASVPIDWSQSDEVAQQINAENIKILVLYFSGRSFSNCVGELTLMTPSMVSKRKINRRQK